MSLSLPARPQSPDRELEPAALARAQQGHAADRQALVRVYQSRVFALIGRMLGPRGRGALTGDLAQDTFVRVLRSLSRFDPVGPARLSTWILTIATRVVFDELRRPRLVEAPLEQAAEVCDADAARMPEQVALRAALQRGLAGLDPGFQAVVLLRDGHGLEYEEIAEVMGINVGTVKSRLSRARAALRAALAETEDREREGASQ
jgi:RNA polymerase sigma-70 factor (ECF subfamily)